LNPLNEQTAALYAGLMAKTEDMPNAENALRDCEKRMKTPRAKYSYYKEEGKREGEGL
jgi:hypothetical protein